MPVIIHKQDKHELNPDTEILILGTFNPGIPDAPEFFYGRPRNFLWHLLPQCYNLDPLKDAPLPAKQQFMADYHIDFADLIYSLEVPEGEENNVDDDFVDSHVHTWNNIVALIATLPRLKAVYFTRKTFNGIPNMRVQISIIAKHCLQKGIRICKLETPARHYSTEKQQQWVDTIVLQKTCLRP